jgi:hypothetical protein
MSGLNGGHYTGEMKSGVSGRKKSTVARAQWASGLVSYGTAVTMATAQMVLERY